jgi:hypothetical protein
LIPHFLDSRLTDSDSTVSLTHRPRSTPQKHYFPASGTHFCNRLNKIQGVVWLEGLGKLKVILLFRSRICDLSACSIVSQRLGCVGLRTGNDAVGKRKLYYPAGNRTLAFQPDYSLYLLSYPGFHTGTACIVLLQWFSTSMRPRPSKFFFYKTRAQPQQIYS